MTKRVAPPTAHMGHNQGPDMEAQRLFELIGPRTQTLIVPFQCGAPWTAHATDAELLELAVDQGRIQRAKRRVKELEARQRKKMNRCIRRMRRAEGKN